MFFFKWMLSALMLCLATSNASAAGFLYFPIEGRNIWTVPISAVPDLDTTAGRIAIFTGESGTPSNGCRKYISAGNFPSCSPSDTANNAVLGYGKSGGSNWQINGLPYHDGVSPTGKTYLFYDNHRAYDFPVAAGSWVGAAATGTLVEINTTYGQLKLQHNYNGQIYQTVYTHMIINPAAAALLNQTVPVFTRLGQVSNVGTGGVHLHFAVLKKVGGLWIPVDPFDGPHPTEGTQPMLWVH